MESVGIYEYRSKDLIGHGAFAVVYKGRIKMVSSLIIDGFLNYYNTFNTMILININIEFYSFCDNEINYE